MHQAGAHPPLKLKETLSCSVAPILFPTFFGGPTKMVQAQKRIGSLFFSRVTEPLRLPQGIRCDRFLAQSEETRSHCSLAGLLKRNACCNHLKHGWLFQHQNRRKQLRLQVAMIRWYNGRIPLLVTSKSCRSFPWLSFCTEAFCCFRSCLHPEFGEVGARWQLAFHLLDGFFSCQLEPGPAVSSFQGRCVPGFGHPREPLNRKMPMI